MRLSGAKTFDAMIHRADAGRKPQPFRRVNGYGGIENGSSWNGQLVTKHFLDLGAAVGDAGYGAELSAGDRGGYADLTYSRRVHCGRYALHRPDPVDVFDGANVIGQAKLYRLGAVGDRTTAYGDDKVGVGGARLFGGRDHAFSRGVRLHRIEHANSTRPEALLDILDLPGVSIECAADHQECS